jgi:glutamine synthetase
VTRHLSPPTGLADFIERHQVWSSSQREQAVAIGDQLDLLEYVRVVFADPHGLARSKTLTVEAFRSVLRNGLDCSPGPFVFDTGHAVAIDFFADGAGIGVTELTGAGDFILVPDPSTFRVLPHTGRPTGWVIGEEYLRDGSPHPLSSRGVLRRACERLAERQLDYVVGLEVEWYVTRFTDPHRVGTVGGFGSPGQAPIVTPVNSGYQFNSDGLLDALGPVLDPLVSALQLLDLPLRTIEHESGPGQLEFTFSPLDGLAAGDAMLLFRNVTKQVLARSGYHASFMALPGLAGFDPSGWHLHQSLADHVTGRNLFTAPAGDTPLSSSGMSYLAGLLDHASAAMLLCVPTMNGYHRMSPDFSLSPDRIGWSVENRGAFLRVLGGPGEAASHIENRIGEPCANPYLYLASQLCAGLDGMDRGLTPGPPLTDPHTSTALPLPLTLEESLAVFSHSAFYRTVLGDALHDCLRLLKTSELTRYKTWLASAPPTSTDRVNEWEHREYFATY